MGDLLPPNPKTRRKRSVVVGPEKLVLKLIVIQRVAFFPPLLGTVLSLYVTQRHAQPLEQGLLGGRYKDCTGKSIENLEKEKASKALLESQNKAQVEFNSELRDEVAKLQAQLAMAQANADRQADKAGNTEARRAETEAALQAAEQRVREGEVLRRKLHNTILVSLRAFRERELFA